MGFVKFLNDDRCVDESGIDLNSAYYYEGKDGKTLTFYEWQEENGIQAAKGQSLAQTQPVPDTEDYEKTICDLRRQHPEVYGSDRSVPVYG